MIGLMLGIGMEAMIEGARLGFKVLYYD